jgi:hypothetical protein
MSKNLPNLVTLSGLTASAFQKLPNCRSQEPWQLNPPAHQGCQMVYFQTKNPNWGKLWRVLQWKLLVYFPTIWYT